MARPKTPTPQKIERNAKWDADHNHRVWKGSLHRGRPHLRPEGKHPVRFLLKIDDPRIYLRQLCDHPLCINEHHFRVQITTDRKYDDRLPPTWTDPRSDQNFTARDLIEVQETLQLLARGEHTFEELTEYHPQHLREEVRRQWMHKSSHTQLTKP